jgi:hypothetical protein
MLDCCEVCFWEDDGQDDLTAHLDNGGPNKGTLWAHRAIFLKHGWQNSPFAPHTRAPNADEPLVRGWELYDGVALDRIPPESSYPWNCLHDAKIMGLIDAGERVRIEVSLPYVRYRFAPPFVPENMAVRFRWFWIELFGYRFGEYARAGTSEPTPLKNLVNDGVFILEAEFADGFVVVRLDDAVLRLQYSHASLRFDTGAPVALSAVEAAYEAYWEDFSNGIYYDEPPCEL